MSSIRSAATAAVTLVLLQMAAGAGTLPPDVERFLAQSKFTTAETAALEQGTVIARVAPGGDDTEVVTTAAVKIHATRPQVAAYYGEMITYVDGQVTQAFGRFGNPAAAADVRALALDAADVTQLKSCRPGDCDLKIGGAGLGRIRAEVDWNAPDAAGQVNARVRAVMVDYVNAYLKSGDDALVTYNDRAEPVSLKQQWQGILAGSSNLKEYSPALVDYLAQYPRQKLPGARDVLYWVKEDYTGLKPVISVVHGVIYVAPEHPDRTIVVQKQLYASRYYNGSLAVAAIVSVTDGPPPVTYLLYGNRSRGDLLNGGFGGIKRKVARDQAKKSAEQTLGTIKSMLERATPGARPPEGTVSAPPQSAAR